MRPSTPAGNNGGPQRQRTRGAIRTHLGRKRTGPRGRMLRPATLEGIGEIAGSERHRQEDLFDRLSARFQHLFTQAGETTLEAFDGALDSACEGLVTAGEFTADSARRLREFVRRDLLHRDNPALTFRTGDVTSAGTFHCAGCGWMLQTTRTTVLPPCPQCRETAFRKSA
jgi:isocitrate dehydrogenase